MNKEVIWIGWFLLGICIPSAKEKTGQVYLEVIDQPIVFGESVQLFCNLSLVPDCCSNTVTWMRNIDVIVHHGTSFDASKYAQIPAQTGFSLKINHFAEKDLYAKFACLYGFNEDSIVLGKKKNKYGRHPTSDEIKINEYLEEKNNVFVIDILFERVLPMPSCILISNDQDLKAQNVTKQHSIGMFYNVSIQLKVNNSFDDCPNNITLKCYIGGYNMSHTVKNGSFCPDIPNVHSDQKNDAKVIIIILLLIVFLSFVVFGSLKFKRVYLSNRGKQQDEELESIALLGTCEPGERQESISSLKRHEREHLLKKETEAQYRKDKKIPIQRSNDLKEALKKIASITTEKGLDWIALLGTCEPDFTHAQAPCIKTDSQDFTHAQAPCIKTHLQAHFRKMRQAQYRTDKNCPIQKNRDLLRWTKLKDE